MNFGERRAACEFWGAHAPSRVVIDALVDNLVEWYETPVFGEGAKDNTRGRVCSPPAVHLLL
jgi:hypothetical protein